MRQGVVTLGHFSYNFSSSIVVTEVDLIVVYCNSKMNVSRFLLLLLLFVCFVFSFLVFFFVLALAVKSRSRFYFVER